MKIWRWVWHYAPVLAVGMVGVAVSVSVWYLTFAAETHARIQEFSGRANNQALLLQGGIDDNWDKLYAVRALFDSSSQPVTREQFESFAKSLLNGHAAILNISWIPRIVREDRAAHELAAVRDGLRDYHIRTVTTDGGLAVSPERDEYFPKFYSTQERTSPVYGIDLHDGGMTEQWLTRMRDGDVLSTSAPLILYIGNGDRRGFFAGLAVYARGLPHDTVEDRRQNLHGFVQAVFQIGVMIDNIAAGVKTPVRLYLFAPDASVNDPPIYFTSRLGSEPIEAKSQAELAAGLNRSFQLNFGDVRWTLMVTPQSAGLATGHEPSSIVLISGLLLSLGLTLFVGAMRRSASNLSIVNAKLEMANDKFQTQNLQFDAALNNMAQGLLMYDRAGKLIVSNRRFADLFGVPWEKWKGATAGTTLPQAMQLIRDWTGVAKKNEAKILSELQSILDTRKPGTIVFEHSDGRTFSALCAPTADGGFVVTLEDITERRRAEDQISHMARYDTLTDLPNRVSFYEMTERLLLRIPQSGPFAVLSLDLDHFKGVNDTLGHPIGDKLLQAAAERMRASIRETDIVARLGGDEFAILQSTFNPLIDATSLATRLIDTVSAPYQLDGHQVVIGTSIGIAIAPGDGADPDQLMRNADLALYRSKADGGSTYRFFETHMDARMQERRALELDLRKALVNGEFTLNYQPIINIKTGRVTSCEALIRWNRPGHGWVAPLDFIPIAEQTGLILPIGEWVLRQACTDAAGWPGSFTIAINVSPVQFKNSKLVQVVTNALEKSGLPASRLELEITELVLMQDNDAALAVLHQLKALGVSIAMDDFGTGYSSLGYLRSFPFDRIKIDQSFIRELSEDESSLAILRAVVGLGRSLNIVTTAEGVETANQLEVLRTEGCTDAQGFLFSQPRSAADTIAMLTSLSGQAAAVA